MEGKAQEDYLAKKLPRAKSVWKFAAQLLPVQHGHTTPYLLIVNTPATSRTTDSSPKVLYVAQKMLFLE